MGLHVSIVVPVYNERYLVGESLRRVLAVESPLIDRLDLIVVDDGSTDGTREILRELAAREPRIDYVEHDRNRGKGAAVRTGIARARGAVTLIHDADLEYDPRDIPALVRPFIEASADAVYGSRFSGGEYRRVLYFGHTLGNRLITFGADLFTDLNLTDVETCYKAVRTRLLQSIPIRSNDFRLEIELTFKLAKRGARIFEVPISYAGRTYQEGKKIGVTDGILAFFAMLRWWIVDDIYDPDEYGSNILVALSEVPRFNRWMADTVRPFVGQRVLEIGAGIGNLTRALIPRDRYTATDINPHYLDYLANFAESRPYLDVRHLDLADPSACDGLAGRYDTVVCLNVLEHVAQEAQGARNLMSVLAPGGRAIVLVPQGPDLYGTLDKVLGHERRYTTAMLRATLETAGFEVERIFGFNRASRPGWWLNGTLLKRERFSRFQLKVLDWMIWLIRRIDRLLPWPGVSLIAVARRPLGDAVPAATVTAPPHGAPIPEQA
jgi:glycosyltransferase involved in cell wall biosynthesis/ubiquinone/menaquinone biosynthesis C-methylase UbiE